MAQPKKKGPHDGTAKKYRTARACRPCQVNKMGCDRDDHSSLACTHCASHDRYCFFEKPAPSSLRNIKPGMIELFEATDTIKNNVIYRLVDILVAEGYWTEDSVPRLENGQPKINELAVRLNCISRSSMGQHPLANDKYYVPCTTTDLQDLNERLARMHSGGGDASDKGSASHITTDTSSSIPSPQMKHDPNSRTTVVSPVTTPESHELFSAPSGPYRRRRDAHSHRNGEERAEHRGTAESRGHTDVTETSSIRPNRHVRSVKPRQQIAARRERRNTRAPRQRHPLVSIPQTPTSEPQHREGLFSHEQQQQQQHMGASFPTPEPYAQEPRQPQLQQSIDFTADHCNSAPVPPFGSWPPSRLGGPMLEQDAMMSRDLLQASSAVAGGGGGTIDPSQVLGSGRNGVLVNQAMFPGEGMGGMADGVRWVVDPARLSIAESTVVFITQPR